MSRLETVSGLRARRAVVLVCLTSALASAALLAGYVSNAHAEPPDPWQPFCVGVTLAPWGQSRDRCYAPGQKLTAVYGKSLETSVCVNAVQNGTLVTPEWRCAERGQLAVMRFDGSRWLNGVIRNNNRSVRTRVYEGKYFWHMEEPLEPPPPSRGWFGPEDLTGPITADPTISTLEPRSIDVFGRSIANTLVTRHFGAGAWSSWIDLGGALAGGPSAVSWSSNRIDVAARAASNTVSHWWWTFETGWHSDELGGNITGDPDASQRGPNVLEIYARSPTGNLLQKVWTTAGWSGWTDIGGGGSLAGGPSAISWDTNRVDVVARTSSNTVTHMWWDNVGGWHFGDNLGGNITGDPDITTRGLGTLDVWARSPTGTLMQKSYSIAGGWTGWIDLGGSMASGPTAIATEPNLIHVVARSNTELVDHWWWVG
jgi:hypothetical protein